MKSALIPMMRCYCCLVDIAPFLLDVGIVQIGLW